MPSGVPFAPQDVDAALIALAYNGGNAERTAEQTGIPGRTLRLWRNKTYRERYLEIAEREAPKLEAMAAQQAREIIMRAADTEHAILDRLQDADDETTSKELGELAGALQRITTSKGINTTKLLELTGRPTQIIAHEDPLETGRRLMKRYGITIESTAEDVPTKAQIPESTNANARDSVSSSDRTEPSA